jgi:gamma-D-glutamyl-L-lysine dipeptidyl-peptidase
MKNKGICNLSVIPLRKHPDSTSEIVSQLLFGDVFSIESISNGWVEIVTDYDHYPGYISQKQYAAYHDEVDEWQTLTAFPFTIVQHNSGTLMLPPGCSVPASPEFTLGNENYSINTTQEQYNTGNIETIAMRYLNTPYLWGGKTPFGIDCSGFTQMVFKQCGVDLPRDAYQQAEAGVAVSFVGETRVGDLAFFDNEAGRITHVGIMLENQKIIHASGRVRIDDLDHYGIMNIEEKQYSHKLRIIKRVF